MILDHLGAFEAALQRAKFPPMSPWWRSTLERFYRSGRRQLVLRVGRRGGKSSSLCRIAVLEALFGEHKVQPGDIGIVALISVSRDEAGKRLRTIEALLRALGVAFKPLREGTGFELLDRPIGFQVFTASIAGVSGPTVICAIGDEIAKWKDSDTNTNPASEVLASLRPTLATMPNAKLFLSSSPLSTVDAHAKAFDEGDTDFQLVAHAPTWVANPTITEAETHALEPDERLWRREYGAQPDASESLCFPAEAVRACIGRSTDGYIAGPPSLVCDFSSGGRDSTAAGVLSWHHHCGIRAYYKTVPNPEGLLVYSREVDPAKDTPREPLLVLQSLMEISGGYYGRVKLSEIVERIVFFARPHGRFTRVFADQRERLGVEDSFYRHGISLSEIVWTATNKADAVSTLGRLICDGQLVIPPTDVGKQLASQLEGFRRTYLPSGAIRFEGRKLDDLVAVCLTHVMGSRLGLIGGSPLGQRHGVSELEVDEFLK